MSGLIECDNVFKLNSSAHVKSVQTAKSESTNLAYEFFYIFCISMSFTSKRNCTARNYDLGYEDVIIKYHVLCRVLPSSFFCLDSMAFFAHRRTAHST